jgi:hypothetical protein
MSNRYALTRQDPPPMSKWGNYGTAGGRPSKWAESLAELVSSPGVWHRVEGFHAPATASYLARGLAAGIEPGDYEATTRREVDGEHAPTGKAFLFVRYVGGEEYPSVGVEPEEDARAVYQGLPASGWRFSSGPPHNGRIVYRVPNNGNPMQGHGYRVWEDAWANVGLPCPGPEPAREDLPPGDEQGF